MSWRKNSRVQLKGWRHNPKNRILIRAESIRPKSPEIMTFDEEEYVVHDIDIFDPEIDGRKAYSEVHIEFLKAVETDSFGLEVEELGVDDR